MRARQFGLLLRTHRADHVHANRARPLRRNQTHPAGGRMEQNRVARFELGGAVEQILHRQPLHHHGRAGLERNRVGQLEQNLSGHVAHVGVSAVRSPRIGDAVAHTNHGHALAHRLDYAGAFHTQPRRQRLRIQPRAKIDVDEVHADRFVAHARLAGPRCAHLNVHQFHHFRAADAVDANCFCHVLLRYFFEASFSWHSTRWALDMLVAQATLCTSQARTRALMSGSCGCGVIGSRRKMTASIWPSTSIAPI